MDPAAVTLNDGTAAEAMDDPEAHVRAAASTVPELPTRSPSPGPVVWWVAYGAVVSSAAVVGFLWAAGLLG